MPSHLALLPRSTPAASGVSSRSIAALLDRLEAQSVECHSTMVVRHGHVVAEGWWAPYSAGRPHLLYSLTRTLATGRPGRYAATRYPVSPERLAESGSTARIVDVCYALLRGYDLSEPDATDAVRLLRSTLHGFSDLEATGGFTADHSLDTSWRRAVETLHHTLTNWSKI